MCGYLLPVVPYAWDEPTCPEKLSLVVKGGRESRQFDLRSFGPQGKLYYESYFCLVIKKEEQVDLTRRQSGVVEFALDVPQGRAVILTKKVCEGSRYVLFEIMGFWVVSCLCLLTNFDLFLSLSLSLMVEFRQKIPAMADECQWFSCSCCIIFPRRKFCSGRERTH